MRRPISVLSVTGAVVSGAILVLSVLLFARADRDRRLLHAVARRDEQAVLAALRDGADPNSRMSESSLDWLSPAGWVRDRKATSVSALQLALGWSVEGGAVTGPGWEFCRDPVIVRSLVAAGADANEADEQGAT